MPTTLPNSAHKLAKVQWKVAPKTSLHGAEKIFTNKQYPEVPNTLNQETSICVGLQIANKLVEERSSLPSVTDVKGQLKITELVFHSVDTSEKSLAFCDSDYSPSWISAKLANNLKGRETPTRLAVHGINSHQVDITQLVNSWSSSLHPFIWMASSALLSSH